MLTWAGPIECNGNSKEAKEDVMFSNPTRMVDWTVLAIRSRPRPSVFGDIRRGLLVVFACAALLLPGCSYYTGVAKADDNVYLTGTTSFLFFTSRWVKRCKETSTRGDSLICLEMRSSTYRPVSFNAHADLARGARVPDLARGARVPPAPAVPRPRCQSPAGVTFRCLAGVSPEGRPAAAGSHRCRGWRGTKTASGSPV
jgi:hypothetical protein